MYNAVYSAVKQMQVLVTDSSAAMVGSAQLGTAAGKLACDASLDIISSPNQYDEVTTDCAHW